MLVRVNISLAILRSPPRCQQIRQVPQADWQGLQAVISIHDCTPISATPDIDLVLKVFHRNLLSLSYAQTHPISSTVVIPSLLPMVHQILW